MTRAPVSAAGCRSEVVSAPEPPLIEARGVDVRYQAGTPLERLALASLSFALAPGRVVGVIGHTGSGKSTLLRVLAGLLPPTAGELRYAPGLALSPRDPRRPSPGRVGLLFQFPEDQLFEETVEKDVAFGPSRTGCPEAEVSECVRTALVAVGLDPEAFGWRSPFELSGGQRRKVALAGVLAMNPRVLLLDEPTSGLDPRSAASLAKLLDRLARTGGVSLLVVSHELGFLARLCDDVIALESGRIVASGPAAEILGDAPLLERTGVGASETARFQARLDTLGVRLPSRAATPETLEVLIRAALGRKPAR